MRKKTTNGRLDEVDRLNPYRLGSKYAGAWRILYKNRAKGITRDAAIDEMIRLKLSDSRKTAFFALQVVASPCADPDSGNRSSKPNSYYVKKGLLLKLVMRVESRTECSASTHARAKEN